MDDDQTVGDGITLRVLIVDDDPVFGALCARYLQRATDQEYVTQTVTLASEGVSRCLEQTFDCLIVDYRLPDTTGTEMLLQLNSALGDAMPPAIVLTAGGIEEAVIQAIRVRAADFMAKPEVNRKSLTRALDNAIVKAKLKRSLSEQNERLQVANDELEKNAEQIRQFYHNVSHEVKTPLTAIQEFINLLNDEVCGPVTDQQREVLGFALSGCDQIAQHFNDLLDLTRMETGKIKIRPLLSDVPLLIRQCVLAAEPEAIRRGISLVNEVNPELPQVFLDPNRFIQILANLLTNAIKFTDENGVITIASDISDGVFSLSVSDTGCGIDEAAVGRIFDRLYQVPLGGRDEASSAGLGLGLSIARDIARMHNGDLKVSSQLGVGSTFTVSLPQQQAADYVEPVNKTA